MYIGIDLGSTNIKAAIYDKNFNLIDRQSRPVVYIRDNGFVEFDAWAYYLDLAGLLADMLKANSVSHVDEIAFTGQAESLVVVGSDGKPMMNAISWMDERSTEECKVLAKQFDAATCEAITGQMAVLPTWPATKILWLKHNRPEIYENAATYMLLKDYIVYCLTGEKVADMSIATFSFYFDIYKKRINRYGENTQERIQGQREKVFDIKVQESVYKVKFYFDIGAAKEEDNWHFGTLERGSQDNTETIQYLLTKVDLQIPTGTILTITDLHGNTNRWMIYY